MLSWFSRDPPPPAKKHQEDEVKPTKTKEEDTNILTASSKSYVRLIQDHINECKPVKDFTFQEKIEKVLRRTYQELDRKNDNITFSAITREESNGRSVDVVPLEFVRENVGLLMSMIDVKQECGAPTEGHVFGPGRGEMRRVIVCARKTKEERQQKEEKAVVFDDIKVSKFPDLADEIELTSANGVTNKIKIVHGKPNLIFTNELGHTDVTPKALTFESNKKLVEFVPLDRRRLLQFVPIELFLRQVDRAVHIPRAGGGSPGREGQRVGGGDPRRRGGEPVLATLGVPGDEDVEESGVGAIRREIPFLVPIVVAAERRGFADHQRAWGTGHRREQGGIDLVGALPTGDL